MVCNSHFHTGRLPNLEFGIKGHFQKRKTLPVSCRDEKLSLTIAPTGARTHDLTYNCSPLFVMVNDVVCGG